MNLFRALVALLLLLPAACQAGQSETTKSASGLSVVPLEIRTAAGKAHAFKVEVARTESEQARGLMFRESLAPDAGMIFPMDPPRPASFWMKNTVIPLDMIFVRADGSIDRIAENTIPESLEPVVSGGEVAAVLELAGGTSAKLGLDETAKVTWKDEK